MFLKNKDRKGNTLNRSTAVTLARWPFWSEQSLRLRLMLWYGGLMALGMACFGLLVLILSAGAINDNVQSAMSSETRIARANLDHLLSPRYPYWPNILMLDTPATYIASGITVEVFDTTGTSHYSSNPSSSLFLDQTVLETLIHGTNPLIYNAEVNGDDVVIEATPIYPPSPPFPRTSPPANAHSEIIGVLLVAKSLHDTNATLALLQGLLLLTGAIMLVLFLICGWAVMGYALRPLSEMVRTASSIASALAQDKRAGDLSQRVIRPGGDDEMAQVVDAFNEMLTAIEGSTAAQRRFIADASHELRAPLTTIQGNLAFLIRYIDDIPPTERRTMLADAHGETLRLASLVEELLLLARADASIGLRVNPSQTAPLVELDRTLLKLVRQMRRRLEIEGTALTIEIGRIEPVRVSGDEESLRRIMVILLENAIKYTRPTEEGKDDGKITVALERVGSEAMLQVSDTGIGIDTQDLPHIFERFYRADRARSREGTGLGLAIASTLVKQLNGRIAAESTPGQGSTFRVYLPLS